MCLAFLSMNLFMLAQHIVVNGTVRDETDEPLSAATVSIVESEHLVIADVDGAFTIEAAIGQHLIVSFVGYEPRTVEVTNGGPLHINLYPKDNELDETVVVGYGVQKRSDIATAISSVNMADIAKSGSSQTLQALQGKVSGLQILTNDGSISSGVTFRMRGVNSITGGTQPLFVIDGVPVPPQRINNTEANINPLLGLNPADIESMEVLKDAAAAAIYGAQGSNGVILITTKKGSESVKPKFGVSFNAGLDFVPTIPMQVLTPEQYAHKMLEHGTFDNQNVTQFWEDVIAGEKWNDPNVHVWMDDITQPAQKYETNLNMQGGTGGTTYMASVGYVNNEGLIRRQCFDRFTSRLNLTQNLSTRANMGLNLSFSSSRDKNPISDWSQSGIVLNALQRSPFLLYPGFSTLMNYSNINVMSPLVAVEQIDITNIYDELNGNFWFSYNILPGLDFNAGGSYRRYVIDATREWGSDTWFGQSEQGRIEAYRHTENSWVMESRLQYAKNIDKHSFTVMGAFEGSKWWMDHLYTMGTNFEDMSHGPYGIGNALVTYAPTLTYDHNNIASWISRATYSYDDRYVVNASVRVDGSSKFGRNNKWGTFPAISAAWRVSQEDFMKDVTWVSNLRARASFGMTGNNQIPSFQSLSLMTANKVVYNGNSVEIGYYPTNVSNDDLKWESQKQWNAGIDVGLWENRISMTADFYYKHIDDMLLEVNIPGSSGYTKAWKNAGSLENRGIDYQLTAHWLRGPWQWTTDFNISCYRNKILSLDRGFQQFYDRGLNSKITSDVVLRVGEPVGTYYGYISDGAYNDACELANGPTGSNATLGELKVVDVNGDGHIDADDRVPIANVNPRHTGGIGNTLSWKGIELYAFMRWSYGNDVINGNAYYLQGTTSINNVLTSVYDGVWSTNHPTGNIPRSGSGTWSEGVMRSDLVEDGSFLRMQTLSLSYDFPKKVVEAAHLSKLHLSLLANNVFCLSRYSGFDPEANTGWGTVTRIAGGMDMSPYPHPRSLSLTVELGL